MKKLITILAIMMVVFGVAFAADPATSEGMEELKVTCTVTAEEPTFTLYGSATSSTASTGDGMTAGEIVERQGSATASVAMANDAIIKANTTIYCVIKQSNGDSTTPVKSTTTYYFSVSATKLKDSTGGTGHETALPTVSAITKISGADVANARTITNGTAGSANTGVSGSTRAQAAYLGLKCTSADIASFNVTWPQTDLVPGTGYEAFITLTIATT